METTILFERGTFRKFRISDSVLNEARATTRIFSTRVGVGTQTTVFLSHSHADLDDLKDIIGFLRSCYNVKVYIDSMDSSVPSRTSGETAARIKNVIDHSDRLIFLATNKAIESKWCNWELGYGDAKKSIRNVAIFPIKEKGHKDSQYKGHEYMGLYHSIIYCGEDEFMEDGTKVVPGYYVLEIKENTNSLIPLAQWLRK